MQITIAVHGKPKEGCPKCFGNGLIAVELRNKIKFQPCPYCTDQSHTLTVEQAVDLMNKVKTKAFLDPDIDIYNYDLSERMLKSILPPAEGT